MNQILKPSIDKNDCIKCEYCKNKLYRKTIEWELYGTKRVITLDYERCNCNDAQAYWNEYDLKKLRMLEEEKKLELMQEFSKRVERIIKNSKMNKRNLSYKFDNFAPNASNKKVLDNLKNYSEKLVNGIEKKGLILVGNNGVGKTHLACSIANKLIENGTPVIYGTLINLLAELKDSYDIDNNVSEMEIIKLYESVDLLIIDDLGKEKPSEWVLEKLFTIVNSRYENNLPVIITTNYNQNSLAERLSINGEIETAKSIISRLYEMCYLVKIDDIDHRIKKKKASNCVNND